MSRRERAEAASNNRHIQSVILSPPDKTLLVVVSFLVIIGFLAIFSATAPKCLDEGGNPAQFLLKQIGCFVVGFIGLKFLANYDYKKLAQWDTIIGIVIIVSLILVDFTPLGVTVNGAKRWISILGFQLQPSEFAKPAVVLLLASAFRDNARLLDKQKVLAYAFIGAMLFLIFKQPNLSMTLLLFTTSVVMYLCAGGSWKFFAGLTGAGIFALLTGAATGLIKPYQMQRITTWLHPEADPLGSGYNIIQSLIAFASGGLSGVGYGASIQKLQYLPECHTDFIFAVIAEELGFAGCVLIVGLFFTFLLQGLKVAVHANDIYGKLLALGITFSIAFQAFMNMSVASSFLPATGVPMPFISYGGSSLIVSLWMVGILLNVSRKRVYKIRNQEGNYAL